MSQLCNGDKPLLLLYEYAVQSISGHGKITSCQDVATQRRFNFDAGTLNKMQGLPKKGLETLASGVRIFCDSLLPTYM